ncbi:hypothetical protein BAY61_09710 [Prauserella marina]|uniref:Uncharacterized protein n=1 Tax=Prauserella marina TaxID=530584 RepID=A0A222VMS9_9PSEU|nr:hypothetical protein [Prauserella marina]ASR35219.1 hypothetical protein BAY61_09710 [Prauserella marina]PWV85013.1 hypothetical protein DES30_1011033 [Prauserella marina]SDC06853.1 hypothetical protein SAMN05421630_101303 [Prauserella marina]
MGRGARDEIEWAERRQIAEQAEQWRRIAGRLPFWRIERPADDAEGPITITEDGQLLATLHGPWAPCLADYLGAMDKASGVALAELLWRIGGHGGSADIRYQARALLHALGLAEWPGTRRG